MTTLNLFASPPREPANRDDATLGSAFDPRANALDFLRFVLASLVIYSHAYPLGGFRDADPIGIRLGNCTLGGICVHCFFFLSGFLITRSAARSPSLARFLWHRALRILPGYWACLLVTVLVFTPLLHWALEASGDPLYRGHPLSTWLYLKRNWWLKYTQYQIGDLWGPNGSVWTLWPEMKCYLLAGLLASCAVLRRQRSLVLGATLVTTAYHLLHVVDPDLRYMPITMLCNAHDTPLLMMFLIGASYYLYRAEIAFDHRFGLAAAALLAWSIYHPTYLLLMPLTVPYLMMWLVIKCPLRNFTRYGDFSYGIYIYAFPVQVILAKLGVARWGLLTYVTLSFVGALILAALSYHLVEKHALRLKSISPAGWLRIETPQPTTVELTVKREDDSAQQHPKAA